MVSVRKAALSALEAVWTKDKKPKEALERPSEDLSRRDRAFLMELTYGVLRYRDTLDWLMKGFLRNPSKLRPATVNNLRLGLYQILYMRVPEWAAVNESVAIERKSPGLVNAVLRNVIRESERLKQALNEMEKTASSPETPEAKRASSIATLTSHPLWLIKRWIKRLGPEEALALAEANNRIPPLTLRVNTLKTARDEVIKLLAGIGIEGEPTRHSPSGITLKGQVAFGELSALSGLITAQDEAGQLIGHMLDPRPGERILDACAAPGGKTTHIAELMGDNIAGAPCPFSWQAVPAAGARSPKGEVVAVDISEKRLVSLRENISRLGLSSVRVLKGDAFALRWKDTGVFDGILLDAPCSATGVIRRNPDVKYRHSAGDLIGFRKKQLGLLRSVSTQVKPGGRLLYSTCSTEPEEGEDVLGRFLKQTDDFYIIESEMPFIKRFLKDGVFRTYPHRDGMDGFFGVMLCRR